jgi:hypothetical protein
VKCQSTDQFLRNYFELRQQAFLNGAWFRRLWLLVGLLNYSATLNFPIQARIPLSRTSEGPLLSM